MIFHPVLFGRIIKIFFLRDKKKGETGTHPWLRWVPSLPPLPTATRPDCTGSRNCGLPPFFCLYNQNSEFGDFLRETYIAFHAGSERLAIMGAWTLVDLFMNKTVGDIGGFQKKLDQLVEKGYLSKSNRDVLEAALETGHAVAHRGHKPTSQDVNLVFDIDENLLQTMILKREAQRLKRSTPKRNSKQ